MASPDFTGFRFCKGHTGPAETLTPGHTLSWEESHSHSRRRAHGLCTSVGASEKRAHLTSDGGPGSQANDGSEALW